MRHEHVVEDHHPGRLPVFRGELRRRLAGPARWARDDGHAGRVDRDRAAHGARAVLRRVGAARHHQELVHVRRAGHDRLGAADDDAVRPPLRDVHVAVRVRLLARPLRAVAHGIRHGDPERQVRVLDPMHVGQETPGVVGAVGVVDAPGRLKDAVQRVVGEVALRAARHPAHQPHRFELVQEVLRRLVDVQHAVDGLAGRALAGGHDGRVLGRVGELVGDADRVDAGREQGLVGDALDPATIHEHPRLVGAQGVPVAGSIHQHGRLP